MKSFVPDCRFWLILVMVVCGVARSVDAEILATLESPPNNQKVTGIGVVAGWAFSTNPQVTITRIQLRIDEKTVDDIAYPGERSDVAQSYPAYPQALNSGFAYGTNFSGLSAGSHKIGVQISDNQGGSTIIDNETTVIQVGDFSLLSDLDLSQASPNIDGKQIKLPFTIATEKPADVTATAKTQQVRLTVAWQSDRQALGIVGSENTNDPTKPTNAKPVSAISAPVRESRAAEGDTILYTLENPSPTASTVSGIGLISGWAFSTTAGTKVENIDLNVDGTQVLTIPCCTSRSDVAQDPEFKDFPQAQQSGFSTEVNFNNLSSDKAHTLEVVIQTGNDKVTIPLTITSVRLGSLPFIDDIDLSGANVSVVGNSLRIDNFKVQGKDSTGAAVSRGASAEFTWEESCQCFITESSCGDGNIAPGEECDTEAFADESCTSLGFTGGTLGCTDTCLFDTKACTGGPSLYVTNVLSNSVSVIDTATNTVKKTIPVGESPRGVAISPDGARAYVTNVGDNTLSVINVADNTVAMTVPVGKGPQSVAVTPDNASIYVVNGNGNSVAVVDAATMQVRTNIAVGKKPQIIALTPDGKFAYVTNYGDNSVSVIDTRTNTVVQSITTNIGKGPNGIAVSPDGKFAYVVNFDGDSISTVDTVTNTVNVAPFALGIEPSQVAFSPDGTRAFISSALDFTVYAVDPLANLSTLGIPIFSTNDRAEPDGVVVSSKGKRLYVAGFGSNGFGNAVNVVSTATNAAVFLIEVGKGPVGVALTPLPK